jgi:hypothetical protein
MRVQYTKQSGSNPNSNTLEPYQLQHGRTAAVSLHFHFCEKIIAPVFKKYLDFLTL